MIKYLESLSPVVFLTLALGFCRTLAEEEPDVVSVAVRPGMVDTGVRSLLESPEFCTDNKSPQMQATLRQTGAPHMSKADHDKFVEVHATGKLVRPEDCGHVIAALALKAPAEFSGKFVAWDSDECQPFRQK